ncbi:hypothetical protein C8J57DRAFT_161731 [Mycena rebaudengoi]|nr:hypothetical protein C8J57DRAFT_161731 [Mycena rebaudengoi]
MSGNRYITAVEQRHGSTQMADRTQSQIPTLGGGIGGGGGPGGRRGGEGGRGEGARLTQEQAERNITAGGGQGGRGGASPWTGGKGGLGQRAAITGPLLSPGAPIPNMTVDAFCTKCKLDPKISSWLYEKGYRKVKVVASTSVKDLEDNGLEMGHIAELKDALEEASARLGQSGY